jgi:hypothetical protein
MASSRELTNLGVLLQSFLRHWKHRSLYRFVLRLEVIHHLSHRHPFDSLMLADILNQLLMHQQDMRSPRNIRMNSHREDELVIFPIEVIEVILFCRNQQKAKPSTESSTCPPQIIHNLTVNPAMAVRNTFLKHHRRQIIQIPICRDLPSCEHQPSHASRSNSPRPSPSPSPSPTASSTSSLPHHNRSSSTHRPSAGIYGNFYERGEISCSSPIIDAVCHASGV